MNELTLGDACPGFSSPYCYTSLCKSAHSSLHPSLPPSLYQVFGGFTTIPWAIHTTAAGPTYYGTGESFLFKLRPFRGSMDSSLGTSKDGVFNAEEEEEDEEEDEEERREEGDGGRRKRHPTGKVIQYFPWTRENTYYMLSTEKSLGMGGGGYVSVSWWWLVGGWGG